eukprot:TRINITY_DN28239_c0_g1_i1.p1 TRINITY_DN28239_c0_g1~~TRINITY_DN28239_c0_g1_i1.p1  ORF type:complete len:456 (+),score=106.18 TRINITY_DN28239_c0_g1_i1:98-1369(+)
MWAAVRPMTVLPSKLVTSDADGRGKHEAPVLGRAGPRAEWRPQQGALRDGDNSFFKRPEPRQAVDVHRAPWTDEWQAGGRSGFLECEFMEKAPPDWAAAVQRAMMDVVGEGSMPPAGTDAKGEVDPGWAAALAPGGLQSFQTLSRTGMIDWQAFGGVPLRSTVRKGDGMIAPLPPSFQGASKHMQLGVGNPVDALMYQSLSFPTAQYNFARQGPGPDYGPGMPALNSVLHADQAPIGAADDAKLPLNAARRRALRGLVRTEVNGGQDTTAVGLLLHSDTEHDPKPLAALQAQPGTLGAVGRAIRIAESTAGAVLGNLMPKQQAPLPEAAGAEYIATVYGPKVSEAIGQDRSGTVFGPKRYENRLGPNNSKPVMDFRYATPAVGGGSGQIEWRVPPRPELARAYLERVESGPARSLAGQGGYQR